MPTSKELHDQAQALLPLPQQKAKYGTCIKCGGTGRKDPSFRCRVCYGSGKAMQYVPFTAEEQAIWDQWNALQKEWLRVLKEEQDAAATAREALPAFRRFQVAASDPEDGEPLYVTVEVWLGEDGVIQTFWEEDDWREDADHPNN